MDIYSPIHLTNKLLYPFNPSSCISYQLCYFPHKMTIKVPVFSSIQSRAPSKYFNDLTPCYVPLYPTYYSSNHFSHRILHIYN